LNEDGQQPLEVNIVLPQIDGIKGKDDYE